MKYSEGEIIQQMKCAMLAALHHGENSVCIPNHKKKTLPKYATTKNWTERLDFQISQIASKLAKKPKKQWPDNIQTFLGEIIITWSFFDF